MSLPRHLRSYREKSKDELARDFYNVPTQEDFVSASKGAGLSKSRAKTESVGLQGMDITAVLSVEGKEEVYVSRLMAKRSPCRKLAPGDSWLVIRMLTRVKLMSRPAS